jgi:multiple sugar transport system substrate-binding protein
MRAKAAIGLLFLACLIMGLMRSDFGGLGGKPKIEINFWNGWTGPDGRIALEMIRDFNEKNPDIHVSMQRIAWALYYNKLMVAQLDKRGPEVFVVHAGTLARMQHAGIIADADDLFSGSNAIPPSDFDKKVLDETLFNGHYKGVPLDIHPQGLYCNADMLKSIGMVNQDGSAHAPTNREEFLKAAQELTKSNNGEDQFGFAMEGWEVEYQALMPQFGGHYLDDKGEPDLDNPKNVEALKFLASLHTKYNVTPPPENQLGWTGYRQKKVAMTIAGVFMLGDLKELNKGAPPSDQIHYIGAPIPTLGDHPGTYADSHCLCIRDNLPPQQREAVERFIRYFSEHSLRWADAGQVPARLSVRADPRFRDMQVQYAFSKQIPWMMYPPRINALFEVQTEIRLAVEKVIRGTDTAEHALQVANENSKQVMERDKQDHTVGGPS